MFGERSENSSARWFAEPPAVDAEWWVDNDGLWRFVDPASSFDHVSRPLGCNPAAESFAFRQLGLVKVRRFGCGVAVRWDVRRVSPEALDSILGRLNGLFGLTPVRLVFFIDGWNDELYRSPRAAAARIEQLSAYRNVEILDTVFLRRRTLADLESSGSLLRRGMEAWERSRGCLIAEDQNPLLYLLPRMLVFRAEEPDGRLAFRHVGGDSACARIFGVRWASTAIGQEAVPDRKYDDRVSDSVMDVMESREPRLDHVRALCERPVGEPVWCPYQRLALPLTTRTGAPALAVLTLLTQDISIPFMAAAA